MQHSLRGVRSTRKPDRRSSSEKGEFMTRRSGFCLAVLIASLCLLPGRSSAYEAITVSDGGTIKGKVVYTAAPPAPRRIVHTKDAEVCGSGARDVEQITIASDKVVQDAVVYLKTVGRGKAWPAPPPPVVVRNAHDHGRGRRGPGL